MLISREFDRAISLEIRNLVQSAGRVFASFISFHFLIRSSTCIEERELLATLKPIKGPNYDPERCCMEGTRKTILNELESWACSIDNSENLLWLYGMAGLGKTAIASSLCQRLEDAGRLAACFYCRRDDPNLGDPRNVIPTLIYKLAIAWSPFRKALAHQLRTHPEFSAANSPPGQQFETLFASPFRKLKEIPSGALVVLVDALDECGTPATRRVVIDIVYRISRLAPWLKVVVTGRQEWDIQLAFGRFDNTRVRTRDLLGDAEALSDVLLFAQNKMATIANNHGFREGWPGEPMINKLAERANGLFIWIQTVALFVDDSLDPAGTLRLVLRGRTSNDAYVSLHELYKTALEVNVGTKEDDARIFRLVIGGIIAVATRQPLSETTLRAIIANQVSRLQLTALVNRLSSLLYRDTNGAIRIHHLSFIDFITDTSPSHICPSQFLVDLEKANSQIASTCLNLMTTQLKFNICNLQTSRLLNTEIPDLQTRIENSISAQLQYSCLHWSSHVTDTQQGNQAAGLLLGEFFSEGRVLFWLEVLSLLGQIHAALVGLSQLMAWIEVRI
jgi:hypothetical protein